jgi:hypothetical protein
MAIVRGLVQGAQALTAVLKDRDLDEMEGRIATLEAAKKETEEREREPPHRT